MNKRALAEHISYHVANLAVDYIEQKCELEMQFLEQRNRHLVEQIHRLEEDKHAYRQVVRKMAARIAELESPLQEAA